MWWGLTFNNVINNNTMGSFLFFLLVVAAGWYGFKYFKREIDDQTPIPHSDGRSAQKTSLISSENTEGEVYSLSKVKVVLLRSLMEQPVKAMNEIKFKIHDGPFGCAVMHTCVQGSKSQWANAWLFHSVDPDFFKEEPFAQLNISSVGDVTVSRGCPPNYHGILEHFQKNGLL